MKDTNENKHATEPFVKRLYAHPMSGGDIEKRSFAIIDENVPHGHLDKDEWEVTQRVIHATGDFASVDSVKFFNNPIESARKALLAGRDIYCDSNMIRGALSLARLKTVRADYESARIHCYISDKEVAKKANEQGLPRALFAIRKAAPFLDGAIVAIGNSPVALLELNRMIVEDGIRPGLVIGMPVGFVHVLESKEELMRLGAPAIIMEGKRGGSAAAVSVIHSLCGVVARTLPKDSTSSNAGKSAENHPRKKAIIILGHGSRVAGAADSMHRVTEAIRVRYADATVLTCNMSRLGPHFPETFEQAVREGAQDVVLVPYFLHEGIHIRVDIPRMMQASVASHPEVRLALGNYLGFDDSIVDLVQKRIEESSGAKDIREYTLPDEADFPLPQGQCEFVPMTPAEASVWRKSNPGKESHSECH